MTFNLSRKVCEIDRRKLLECKGLTESELLTVLEKLMDTNIKMFTRNPATARIGEEILPFETTRIPEFFQRKAEVELRDTPERRIQGLRQIKEMAKNDKVTKDIKFSDEFLMQYLRARKYNVAKSFSQLKAFVNLKRKFPQIFCNFRYENIVKTITHKIVTVLPWRCQDGCAILLIELDNWNPDEFPIEEVKRMVVLLLLQSLREPMTQVNGFKVIFDVKSNPLRHLKHATPANLYLLIHGTQDCVPGRYKGVHIVNNSLTFKTAWMILKHFLPDKLKSRIIFHSTPATLLNFFPSAVLPVHYGGELKDYDMTHWLQRVMQHEELEKMIGGV